MGVAAGFLIPFKADALITAAEYGAPIAAEKGNQKIDELRQTAAFGGERRGEAAVDEITDPDQ